MEEATALSVVSEESTSLAVSAPIAKPYPLDQPETILRITGGKQNIEHKLRRPTLPELEERDKLTPLESEEVSNTEDRLQFDDEFANARLWDKLAISVIGYKGPGFIKGEWNTVTPELAAMIPWGHKATAIRGWLFSSNSELESDDDDGFALGAETFVVKQSHGVYLVRHFLRAPTEGERRDFRRRSNETRYRRGTRKVHTTLLTKLRPYVELYDKLFIDIENATVEDQPLSATGDRARFLSLIDPGWKRGAIDALMRWFEASMSDSSVS